MRRLQLTLVLILTLLPTLASAYGGYYTDPKKKKLHAASKTNSVLSTRGGSGLNSPSAAVSASPTAGTQVSTAPPSGTSFGTQIRSFTDTSAATTAQGAANGGAASQVGAILGAAGLGAGGGAQGGAGLGGGLGGGACPTNMHQVPNLNGGQNCVPGAGTSR